MFLAGVPPSLRAAHNTGYEQVLPQQVMGLELGLGLGLGLG